MKEGGRACDTTNGDSQPELSVVVLCYRAGEGARDLVKQLRDELEEPGIDYELVLVANFDEGVKDSTPEVVKEIAAGCSRCRAVVKLKEGRMGWDMRSGLIAATGRHIAVIDGDGQMPTSDVVVVYDMLKSGKYDLVKTFRANRYDGISRVIQSYGFNLLFRLLFPSAWLLRDINSKPKVMTREAFDKMKLQSNDWFTDSEIMLEALRLKIRIGEISTVFQRNERRGSFVKFSTVFEFMGNLVYYRLRR